MTDKELRAFLDLMMCSDPWPITWDEGTSEDAMKELANRDSLKRGYDSWIVADHELTAEARNERAAFLDEKKANDQ